MSRDYRRPDGAPYRHLQTTVDPSTADALKAAARRQGITLSLYIDLLVADLARRNDGELPQVPTPIRQEGMLPIDTAA